MFYNNLFTNQNMVLKESNYITVKTDKLITLEELY